MNKIVIDISAEDRIAPENEIYGKINYYFNGHTMEATDPEFLNVVENVKYICRKGTWGDREFYQLNDCNSVEEIKDAIKNYETAQLDGDIVNNENSAFELYFTDGEQTIKLGITDDLDLRNAKEILKDNMISNKIDKIKEKKGNVR